MTPRFSPRALPATWLLALLLSIAACDATTPEESLPEPEPENCLDRVNGVFEPMQKDNYWTYRTDSYFDGEREEGRSRTSRIAVEDVHELRINDGAYIASEQRVSREGLAEPVSTLWWNGPDGHYTLGMYAPADTFLMAPGLWFKYPAEVGDRWQAPNLLHDRSTGTIAPNDSLPISVAAVDVPFETPVDTFETIAYFHAERQAYDVAGYWQTLTFYRPGIGLVGREVYLGFDSTAAFDELDLFYLRYRQVLTEYCLH